MRRLEEKALSIHIDDVDLLGHLRLPVKAEGMVIFVHGSGSSRLSPRNQYVARMLNDANLATFLFDLLSPEESDDPSLVFDIPFLATRLTQTLAWLEERGLTYRLPIGLFGASTGAGAALWALSELKKPKVAAVVSRGGRPDLAIDRLDQVLTPTLLIVGAADAQVIDLNQMALQHLCRGQMLIIPRAGHLFEEPGTLDRMAQEALSWFKIHFQESRSANKQNVQAMVGKQHQA